MMNTQMMQLNLMETQTDRMSRRYDIQDPTSQHTGKEPGVIDAARTTIENMVS